MSGHPAVVLVALHDGRPRGGTLSAVHEIGCAELRAALHARGVRADQLVEEVTTLEALTAATLARGARVVAFCAGDSPAVSAALGRALAGIADGPSVVVLGHDDPPLWPASAIRISADDAVALAALAGGRADAQPPEPTPSPWLLGLLPARAASHVGVRADVAPERMAAELEWIERRSPLAQVVPLLGPAAWAGGGQATERIAALARRARPAYVRVAPRLDPRTASPETAAALARAGAAELVLLVDAAAGVPDLAPAIALAHAAAATEVRVELRLSGEPERDEAWIAAVARAGLAFDVDGDADLAVVPELQRARSYPARAAVIAQSPQRLRRALEGCSPAASRIVDHALDVLWEHADDPCLHEDWLASLLAASSTLTVLRPGRRPPQPTAPLPLRRVTAVGVEPAGTAGASNWHVDGELWHVRPYGAAAAGAPLRPLVLTVTRREDLDALVADADAAQVDGCPPGHLVHPQVTIAGLGALTGDDPGTRLAHLVVGADGAVRAAPGARPLGRIGDPFERLRAAAFERRAAHDALVAAGGSVGAPSLPAWLPDGEAARLLAERPQLRVLAHLPRLLRALARPGEPPPLAGDVRVGGLGGALAYDGPVDPRRPLRRLVARIGERHAIYDLRQDRALVVGTDLAAICEGLDATGDAATVAGWLAAARGLPGAAAGRAVATAVARLQSGGLLDPAELVAQPARAQPPHAAARAASSSNGGRRPATAGART